MESSVQAPDSSKTNQSAANDKKGVRLATALNFERVGLVNRPSQQSYCWRHHLGFKGMAMRADLRLEGLRSSHFCGADLERGCLRRLPE
jgi:hypothetical protein